MKAFLLGIAVFLLFIFLAGSKYAYNPPHVQKEFCKQVQICGNDFFPE